MRCAAVHVVSVQGVHVICNRLTFTPPKPTIERGFQEDKGGEADGRAWRIALNRYDALGRLRACCLLPACLPAAAPRDARFQATLPARVADGDPMYFFCRRLIREPTGRSQHGHLSTLSIPLRILVRIIALARARLACYVAMPQLRRSVLSLACHLEPQRTRFTCRPQYELTSVCLTAWRPQ